MSNHLAVATVTAGLRQRVGDAVRDVVSGAEVTHVRPGGSPAATPPVGVNVFLYGVTPNPALRNTDLPSRRADGAVAKRPAAALDLHYLISFYGEDRTLEPQRMLGSVVRSLHAHPALSRAALRDVVEETAHLAGSDLADALETVRFTPVTLSLEELSKLWSVLFQTQYALSVAYAASAVLIEADETERPVLPVAARRIEVATLAAGPSAEPPPAAPVALEAVAFDAGPEPRITATVAPPARRGQRATLLLNRTDGAGSLALDALPREGDAAALVFPAGAVAAGAYLARVRVDGAESALEADPAGGFAGPTVNVP